MKTAKHTHAQSQRLHPHPAPRASTPACSRGSPSQCGQSLLGSIDAACLRDTSQDGVLRNGRTRALPLPKPHSLLTRAAGRWPQRVTSACGGQGAAWLRGMACSAESTGLGEPRQCSPMRLCHQEPTQCATGTANMQVAAGEGWWQHKPELPEPYQACRPAEALPWRLISRLPSCLSPPPFLPDDISLKNRF